MAPTHSPDDSDRTLPPDSDQTIPSDPRTLPTGGDSLNPATSPSTPTSIGNYTILGKLGEGGMGVVYEAEQQNPKRKVALKVVRGGHFVDELSVKMFQREAETLGRLKHSGIGAIYESGRTDEGQHFFAMELVRGETLDAHLMRKDSPTSERLALFRKICDAVNYAHQRGVIHRDLKPSNIVISEEGDPKILDFGLARITDADAAAVSMTTEVGAIKGTLPYMSPEQARGNPDEIDLRTDVYSLGVIFYELLSGSLPYDLKNSSIVEIVWIIAEAPPNPLESNNKELETITLKALEKDPDRRYQSAAAFSDDIGRHLTNQPILARPASTIYQLKKLVARNKLPFAFASTLVALLIGFGIWMSLLFTRAETARQESEAVTDFLSNMLAAVDPGEQGRDVTVREILDEGSKIIEEEFEDQPLIRARLRSTIGETHFALGEYALALQHLEPATETRRRLLGPMHPQTLNSMHSVALLYEGWDQIDEAEELTREVLVGRQRVLGEDHRETLDTKRLLVEVLRDQGRLEEAETMIREVSEMTRNKYGEDDRQTLQAGYSLTRVLSVQGKYEEAKDNQRPILEGMRRVFGEDHPNTLEALTYLGGLHWRLGEFEQAESLLVKGVESHRISNGPHPMTAWWIVYLATNVMLMQGRYDEAETLYREGIKMVSATLGDDHQRTVDAKKYLAVVLYGQDKIDEARALTKELERTDQAPGADAEVKRRLARFLLTREPVDQREPDWALRLATEANDQTNYENAAYLRTLALAYHLTAQPEKALETQKRALSLLAPDSSDRSVDEERLAQYIVAHELANR